jgi:hypothetical protein
MQWKHIAKDNAVQASHSQSKTEISHNWVIHIARFKTSSKEFRRIGRHRESKIKGNYCFRQLHPIQQLLGHAKEQVCSQKSRHIEFEQKLTKPSLSKSHTNCGFWLAGRRTHVLPRSGNSAKVTILHVLCFVLSHLGAMTALHVVWRPYNAVEHRPWCRLEFAHWPEPHAFHNCVVISISFVLTLGSMLVHRMSIHVDMRRARHAWISRCAVMHVV